MPTNTAAPRPIPTIGAGAPGFPPANAGVDNAATATPKQILSVRDMRTSRYFSLLWANSILQSAIAHADQYHGANADAEKRRRGSIGLSSKCRNGQGSHHDAEGDRFKTVHEPLLFGVALLTKRVNANITTEGLRQVSAGR